VTRCVNRNGAGVSLLETDTRDMVDHLELILYSHSIFKCFKLLKMIMQLFDSDCPNIQAGLHFRAQENGPMSPDSVCAIIVSPAGYETKCESCL